MPPAAAPTPRHPFAAVLVLVLTILWPFPADSGDWRVSPIRVELGKDARTGVITIVNERPEKFLVQLRAMEWTQDGDGQDAYDETTDLIFFPRIITFDKAEERIVRIGIKAPPAAREKSYRLFIEEIPGPQKPGGGVNVAIALRIGVPVFLKPVREEGRAEIVRIGMSQGEVSAVLKNTGTVHVIVRSVKVSAKDGQGKEIFSRELSGWYLLAGAARRYATDIPPESCDGLASIDVDVRTDRFELSGKMDADKAMCAP